MKILNVRKLAEIANREEARLYFISPHFDDAVLSSGALLFKLSSIGVDTAVVNVFTKSESGKQSLSAKAFLRQCGYKDPRKLFSDRQVEDAKVLENATGQIINLDLTDSLWRKHSGILEKLGNLTLPEIAHIYPTYRWHIVKGRISRADSKTLVDISEKLNFINKNDIVFCPLSVGNHVDHVIVNKICREKFERLIFWKDYPYSLYSKTGRQNGLRTYSYGLHKKGKEKMIKGYKTQFDALFPNDMKLVDEVYYTNIKL